jgi:hypothetical protein
MWRAQRPASRRACLPAHVSPATCGPRSRRASHPPTVPRGSSRNRQLSWVSARPASRGQDGLIASSEGPNNSPAPAGYRHYFSLVRTFVGTKQQSRLKYSQSLMSISFGTGDGGASPGRTNRGRPGGRGSVRVPRRFRANRGLGRGRGPGCPRPARLKQAPNRGLRFRVPSFTESPDGRYSEPHKGSECPHGRATRRQPPTGPRKRWTRRQFRARPEPASSPTEC